MATIVKANVIENSAGIFLRQLLDTTGAAIGPSAIASMTLKAFHADGADLGQLVVPEGEDAETYTGTTLDPADVLYSTLQTGYRATQGGLEDGFNLRIDAHGSYWPEAGKYQIEVKVTPNVGDPFYLLWDLKALNIFSE